jgi:hypothetical protein
MFFETEGSINDQTDEIMMDLKRQDTQYNDTQHNDTQHNYTQHNDAHISRKILNIMALISV